MITASLLGNWCMRASHLNHFPSSSLCPRFPHPQITLWTIRYLKQSSLVCNFRFPKWYAKQNLFHNPSNSWINGETIVTISDGSSEQSGTEMAPFPPAWTRWEWGCPFRLWKGSTLLHTSFWVTEYARLERVVTALACSVIPEHVLLPKRNSGERCGHHLCLPSSLSTQPQKVTERWKAGTSQALHELQSLPVLCSVFTPPQLQL